MHYNAPLDDEGKPYYVPVVAKNRDYLVGYINGMETSKSLLSEIFEQMGLDMDLDLVEVILDSTRFNDVLETGQRESEMTDDELKEYIYSVVENVTTQIDSDNVENNVGYDQVLSVECTCGLGFYSWDSIVNIPHESVKCSNCGRYVIHYTGVDDYFYEFDGGR